MSLIQHLPEIFSKNRFEESNEDNWADFVVPHFLNDLGIKSQSKAIVIIGGRGCGKTTLLRYFSHATQFSPRRPDLPLSTFQHIGLYWRADTNFLNAFTGGEQSPETWLAAFQHLLACDFGREILRSLRSINCNPMRQNEYGGLNNLDFSILQDFDPTLGSTLSELDRSLQKKRTQLAMWINNLDIAPKPIFLPVPSFLSALINVLKEQLPYLINTTFAIFIDEYENLRDEQQRFINGLLKHGSQPLLFNIAMKRNGWHTKETLGSESIQEISDYRVIDLEEYLIEDFDLFAAELLFLRLAEYDSNLLEILPIIPDELRSIKHIDQRYKNPKYRTKVIAVSEKILPRVNERSAAGEILKDSKLRDKLIAKIKEALEKRNSPLSPTDFLDDNFPEASVLMPALLSRPKEKIEQLLSELNELRNGKENRLSVNNSLITNNLFGCVNACYLGARRNSILFSGFTALTLIAKGNTRHLLELFHAIFKAYQANGDDELPVFPPHIQARAVREASESILRTVNGRGTYGPQLYGLVSCLGSIFRERHRNDKQSEPETNHFTIVSGDINEKLRNYLDEAEKWSVLFLSRETKMKTTGSIGYDYTLNPIFAPFYQISFRKKRSLQVSTEQLIHMFEGDQKSRDALVRELGLQEVQVPNRQNCDIFES
jgi:hypothetical protein